MIVERLYNGKLVKIEDLPDDEEHVMAHIHNELDVWERSVLCEKWPYSNGGFALIPAFDD